MHKSCVLDVNHSSPEEEDNVYCSFECRRFFSDEDITPELWKIEYDKLKDLLKAPMKKLARNKGVQVAIGKIDFSINDIRRRVIEKILIENRGNGVAHRKTIHCQFRLLNILYSDEMFVEFFNSGNCASKEELESRSIGKSSKFWINVHESFLHGLHDCCFADKVNFHHPMFENANIDPSKIIPHSQQKLYDIWKDIQNSYNEVVRNFTLSGNHNSSFSSACILNRCHNIDNTEDDENSDIYGMEEKGFCMFNPTLPVIYLRMFLNEKQDHMGLETMVQRKIPASVGIDSEEHNEFSKAISPLSVKSSVTKSVHKEEKPASRLASAIENLIESRKEVNTNKANELMVSLLENLDNKSMISTKKESIEMINFMMKNEDDVDSLQKLKQKKRKLTEEILGML